MQRPLLLYNVVLQELIRRIYNLDNLTANKNTVFLGEHRYDRDNQPVVLSLFSVKVFQTTHQYKRSHGYSKEAGD